MKKTYRGSCHCGRVVFEADLDLAKGTTKCNCTFCWKRRWWGMHVGLDDFRAISGEEELVPYPASSSASGPSGCCKHCGIAPYARGDAAEWNEGPYVSINLACLDDLTPAELLTAPVEYLDGRADTWETPAETRHL